MVNVGDNGDITQVHKGPYIFPLAPLAGRGLG
jgi:hypothetical protein